MVDNERVIVTEWRFAPDAETGWHRHKYDYVVIPQTTATLRSGQPYFRAAGMEHSVINSSGHECVFIEVEIKAQL